MTQDEFYMRRCLELALQGAGTAAPNPMVGSVLVHKGRIIGEGWHQQFGEAHAEVNCFNSVAAEDQALIPESRMYVSLEPCAHLGKTPPCADRIVQEGVKEVIIANRDPFDRVNGAGIDILERAGIQVTTGVLEAEGRWTNRRFFTIHERKRPYIILKWAQSAEGFMAPSDRSRRQLTNQYSNTLVHRWRTEESAILVGFNTALRDNPQLTARHWPGIQPLRVVLDQRLELPQTNHLFDTVAPTWVINERVEYIEGLEGNTTFLKLDFGQDLLPQLMERFYRYSRISVIVEGGPALLQTFIRAGLWDEARIFRTPVPLGDGLAAPLLPGATLALETAVGEDRLQLWLNEASGYAYPAGMSL